MKWHGVHPEKHKQDPLPPLSSPGPPIYLPSTSHPHTLHAMPCYFVFSTLSRLLAGHTAFTLKTEELLARNRRPRHTQEKKTALRSWPKNEARGSLDRRSARRRRRRAPSPSAGRSSRPRRRPSLSRLRNPLSHEASVASAARFGEKSAVGDYAPSDGAGWSFQFARSREPSRGAGAPAHRQGRVA